MGKTEGFKVQSFMNPATVIGGRKPRRLAIGCGLYILSLDMFGNVWIMSCAGDGSLLSCFRSPDLTVNVNTALVFPKRRNPESRRLSLEKSCSLEAWNGQDMGT